MARLFRRRGFVVIGETQINLRTQFKIDKTQDGTANKGLITIVNASPATRSLLERQKENKGEIQLVAGYEDGIGTLFLGDVLGVNVDRQGADIMVNIEAEDKGRKIVDARLELGFTNSVTSKQIIEEAIKALAVGRGTVKGLIGRTYEDGFSYSGKASDLLDQITQEQELDWNIRDGDLQIIPKGETTGETAVLLGPDTGMLGVPSKTENGFSAVSLLNNQLNPGRLVKLVNSTQVELNGFYKVEKVIHTGDTKEGAWTSTVEGKDLG